MTAASENLDGNIEERRRARTMGLPPVDGSQPLVEPVEDFDSILDTFAGQPVEDAVEEVAPASEAVVEVVAVEAEIVEELEPLEGEIADPQPLAPRPGPDEFAGSLEEDDALWSQLEFGDDDEEDEPEAPKMRKSATDEQEEAAAAEEPPEEAEPSTTEALVAEPVEAETVEPESLPLGARTPRAHAATSTAALAEDALVPEEFLLEAEQPDEEPEPEAEATPKPVATSLAVEPGQELYVSARRGVFVGPNVLSLMGGILPDYDEMNNVFTAFSDLAEGQRGFIRISARSAPEFKQEARSWVKAVKSGVDPEPEKRSPLKMISGWVSYILRYSFFEMTKGSTLVKGSAPLRPGQTAGSVKAFTASSLDDEEKQQLRDADKKAQEPTHFDVTLHVGTIGKAEDKEDLERILEDAVGGYSVYGTSHQELAFVEASALDASKGFMPGDKKLVLSATEIGELAKIPDGTTQPDGIKVTRSTFRHIQPINPITILDALNPVPGQIPFGVINPHSEDRRVIGLNNRELDQHLFFCGRSQPLAAPVLTDAGWREMASLAVGDHVVDPAGGTATIVAVHPQGERPIYAVSFSDGVAAECDLEHLWRVRSSRFQAWEVITLREIITRLAQDERFEIPRASIDPCQQPRFLLGASYVGQMEAQCIKLDSENALYITGGPAVEGRPEAWVVTHNTGTGKSKMMEWMIFGVAKADYPIVVIDPHGQLSDDVLNALVINCPERLEDIVYCDLGDEEWPVAYNPLDIHSKEQIEPTVASVKEMLQQELALSKDSAPRAVNYAEQALNALCEANLHLRDPETKCTLLHITTFFQDAEFRQSVINFCSNQSVRESFDPDTGLFEQYSDKQRTEIIQPIVRAFQPLGNSASFSAVFSAGENRLQFTDLISQNKIVLVRLARHHHQAAIGEFIGSLILPYLLSSVSEWGRSKDPITREERGRGARIFVDEAPTLLGPDSAATKILAEARKYDLGLIFAAQFLEQLDPRVAKETLANTASKLTLALDPSSARLIGQSVDPTGAIVKAAAISELPNFHFYANLLWPGEGPERATSGVFSAACLPPLPSVLSDEHIKARQAVVDRSRLLICNRKAEIDSKRRTLNDNIKSALNTLHQDRLNSDDVPVDLQSGASFGMSTDSDPTRAWK